MDYIKKFKIYIKIMRLLLVMNNLLLSSVRDYNHRNLINKIVKKLITVSYLNINSGHFNDLREEYILTIAKNCILIHTDGEIFWEAYNILRENNLIFDYEKQWYIDNSGLARWYH